LVPQEIGKQQPRRDVRPHFRTVDLALKFHRWPCVWRIAGCCLQAV
jgi:hypothetical protein